MSNWLEDIGFKGYYTTPSLDFNINGDSALSSIYWTESIPDGSSLILQSSLSLDNGLTWSKWEQCFQSQSIPNVKPEISLNNAKIKFRGVFQTNNQNKIPLLGMITINLTPVIIYNNIGDIENQPELWITKIGNGDFSLINISNNNEEFKFKSLIDNETVYINNYNQQIETTIPGYYRFGNFNDNYLNIPVGVNIFKVSGKAKIQFRTEFKVLA